MRTLSTRIERVFFVTIGGVELKISFIQLPEAGIAQLNGGKGQVYAKMSVQQNGKIMLARIPAGASIGLHRHETSDDVNYVLSGAGKAVCDGIVETLTPGVCHLCHKGSSHSILNDGSEDLVLFTVVTELAE